MNDREELEQEFYEKLNIPIFISAKTPGSKTHKVRVGLVKYMIEHSNTKKNQITVSTLSSKLGSEPKYVKQALIFSKLSPIRLNFIEKNSNEINSETPLCLSDKKTLQEHSDYLCLLEKIDHLPIGA